MKSLYDFSPIDDIVLARALGVIEAEVTSITPQPMLDDWRLRVYSLWDLRVLLPTLEGWTLDGFYTCNDLKPKIAGEDHYFMVLEAT